MLHGGKVLLHGMTWGEDDVILTDGLLKCARNLTQSHIITRHAFDPAALPTHPVGSGPFRAVVQLPIHLPCLTPPALQVCA